MSATEALHPVVDPAVPSSQQPVAENKSINTAKLGSISIADPETRKEGAEQRKRKMNEGVEVVLDHSNQTVVDGHHQSNQSIFRGPEPVRPRAVRAHGGTPPHVTASGSYGYAEYGHGGPYSSAYSASFEEGAYAPPTTSHYSPHIQYPPLGRHAEDVNVVSPQHKEHGGHRPPMTPRRAHHAYNYPPASPVSRPGSQHSPPRMRGYAMRRPEGPYSAAQRARSHPPSRHPEDAAWGPYSPDRSRPPIVAESSFDSEHYASHASVASHPATPIAPHYGPPMHHEHPAHQQGFYSAGAASFGGSFDSPAPGYYPERGYYGHPPPYHHPESPITPYSHGYPGYAPGSYHDGYPPHPEYGRHPHYDHDDYHHGHPHYVSPNKKDSSGMILPKAAQEIDFDVTDPPMEPITQPSKTPICGSPGEVNSYDVLCGRGGGTNSQIGNRRFRKLVQEFQPTYLLARRKEKPLLARTIVLIIRKRGGRFLKKDDETGELFEVGDAKAEAKTSQALREGLDVRATKSAASNLMDKKKKKASSSDGDDDKDDPDTPASHHESPVASHTSSSEQKSPAEAALSLPRLNEDQAAPPPSPNSTPFRKRRRMRSAEKSEGPKSAGGCGDGFQDKLFPDFCPPRADLHRVASPVMHDMPTPMDTSTPTGSMKMDDDIYASGSAPPPQRPGCAGIALDVITGAAAGSFCLGPRKWR
eukprot:scaffold22642_cov134-Cylindrotheca_fusiformis.AAC.4